MATTLCVTNKCSQMKLEVNEDKSEDEEDLANRSLLQPIVTTLSKLKRKLVLNRGVDVKEKMEVNNAKLLDYTSLLHHKTKEFQEKCCSEDDKLTFRSQKVLCNMASTEAGSDGKDESSGFTAPILLGNNSVGKMAVRPIKLGSVQNVPTYTTWIYLDRNQRMTEDQSVQGRRRIYYDPVGNETLIASDSEEEEVEDEESQHDFSKGEDYIIWTAVLECGASDLLFEQIADSIRVKQEEVEARYELLLNDTDKQAKCEAHAEGIRSKVSSPATRRKGTRDQGRFSFKESQTGTQGELYQKTSRNRQDLMPDEVKLEAKDLVAAMDSFDNLYCRRCLVFDCRLHGCSQPLVHPSERQPSAANLDLESPEPCGAQCYLSVPKSLQRTRDAPSNSHFSEVLKLTLGDQVSFLAEGMDRARVAKRQKTQSGETCWPSEALEPEIVVEPSVRKDGHIGPDRTLETPPLIDSKHASESHERDAPIVGSNHIYQSHTREALLNDPSDAPQSCKRDSAHHVDVNNVDKIHKRDTALGVDSKNSSQYCNRDTSLVVDSSGAPLLHERDTPLVTNFPDPHQCGRSDTLLLSNSPESPQCRSRDSPVDVDSPVSLELCKADTPLFIDSINSLQHLKKDQVSVASRLTSHKKLARNSSRRLMEENCSFSDNLQKSQPQVPFIDLTGMDDTCSPQKVPVGQSLQKSQKAVTVIDLTEVDGESSKEESTHLSHNRVGVKAVDGVTHQLGRLDVSMEATIVRDRSFKDERTGVTLTKKLARSGKRAFLETSLPSGDISRGEDQGDPRNSSQRQVELESPDARTALLVSKVATAVKQTAQEQLLAHVPPSSGGVSMDMDPMGVDIGMGKGKGTSPKKLARSVKMTVVENISGGAELLPPQIQGDLLTVAPEAEQPAENSRNSAARKLARSAKKNFAEKVAVAIQHQQLQALTDPNNARGGRMDKAREERHGGASFQEYISTKAGSVIAQNVEGRSTHGLLSRSETLRNSSIELKKEPPKQGFTIKEGSLLQNQMTPHDAFMKDVGRGGIEHAKEANPVLKKVHRTGDLGDFETDIVPVQNEAVVELTETSSAIEVNLSKVEGASNEDEFIDNWSALEKGLYEKGLQIFERNSCMIARCVLKGMKTCAEVRQYISAQEKAALRGAEDGIHQLPDSVDCVLKWDAARARARLMGKKKGSRKLKFTLKSAGQSAIRKRMANGKDAPCRQYTPCGCLFTCGKQCPCQLSGTCCEKYCGCAKTCKNRFRGCHCAKSQCCSRQCPCFAAGRECDPDVCRNCWIGCGDGHSAGPPQREDKDNYQCHNMKLLLKQQQRVLLGRSDVAGWGAFLKNSVNKHDYLGEYTGELISHREADKRGKIYDRENSSFLFNLNDQCVLDACRKGDKLKFANHSPNPNCYAKVLLVAGDHRVGIFAKERIMAGEELFYDYRYEAERAPVWAKKGEDSGNGKKDDTGPSERRSKQAS